METRKLQAILLSVTPGLAKKETFEQATHFIFTGKDVLTYNDAICIYHPCETSFIGSVKANDFYKLISGISDKEIELKKEKTQLKLTSEHTKAGLAFLDSKEKDVVSHVKDLGLYDIDKDWLPLPEDFNRAVFLCMFAASRDKTQDESTCVFVNGKDVWGGDDVRISHFAMTKRVQPFLIKATAAAELVKFSPVEYALGESWIHFKTKENVVFSARRIANEDAYPDLSDFMKVEGANITLPTELKDIAESIAYMVDDSKPELDRVIDVKIGKKKIYCRAENQQGWIEKTIAIESDEKAEFSINPIFLAQVLDKTTTGIIDKNIVKFSAGSFEHLIALRVKKEEE